MLDYVENVFSQTFNILGHKLERFKNQVRMVKDWIMAKAILRDPKAIKSMLHLVELRKFHNKRDKELIRERWAQLWTDIKFYKGMMERMTKVYLNYHYPDGFIRSKINNWLGIKNERLEEALKKRTSIKTKRTTTKVYDEKFVLDYMERGGINAMEEQKRKK